MGFAQADLSHDGFLGGRLHCWQPRRGYRSGTDAVLLAAAVGARAGEAVLELGCGVGVALACLAVRVPGLALTGLELQPDYAALAEQNLAGTGATLVVGDAVAPPPALRTQSYDHVLFNPPYHDTGAGSAPRDAGRAQAHQGSPDLLAAFFDCALRRLAPGGALTAILPAAALRPALPMIDDRAGAIHILPLAARQGRAADRVILSAKKGARAPLTLLPPLVMHDGPVHAADGDDYSAAARAILREGAALKMQAQV